MIYQDFLLGNTPGRITVNNERTPAIASFPSNLESVRMDKQHTMTNKKTMPSDSPVSNNRRIVIVSAGIPKIICTAIVADEAVEESITDDDASMDKIPTRELAIMIFTSKKVQYSLRDAFPLQSNACLHPLKYFWMTVVCW